MKEAKDKKNFARASWRSLKKALKLLFERRLGAEKVEMRFTDTRAPATRCLMAVVYEDNVCKESCCWLRWAEDLKEVHAKSWIDLARTLETGAREGKSFSIGRKTVFDSRDSIERALVEADLLCG